MQSRQQRERTKPGDGRQQKEQRRCRIQRRRRRAQVETAITEIKSKIGTEGLGFLDGRDRSGAAQAGTVLVCQRRGRRQLGPMRGAEGGDGDRAVRLPAARRTVLELAHRPEQVLLAPRGLRDSCRARAAWSASGAKISPPRRVATSAAAARARRRSPSPRTGSCLSHCVIRIIAAPSKSGKTTHSASHSLTCSPIQARISLGGS